MDYPARSTPSAGLASVPVPPLNLVGDFGGGGMLLAYGLVCGLLEAQRSGQGQVIDAAMVDGAAALMGMFFSFAAQGGFTDQRGTNLLDGAAHFYDTYETADGKHVCLGSIEPQFYALLIEKAGLDPETFKPQMDRRAWPELKAKLTEVMKQKTRDEWCAIMEGTDVCFALCSRSLRHRSIPTIRRETALLRWTEFPSRLRRRAFHAQFQRCGEVPQPRAQTAAVLADFGFSEGEVAALMEGGAVAANG